MADMNEWGNNTSDSVSGVENVTSSKKGKKIAIISASVIAVAAGAGAIAYNSSDYIKNQKSYDSYYDSVEVCVQSANAHPKSAIQIRNRSMVDRSDLCVFCVTHKSGGAYQTLRYAEKADANIINLRK